MTPAIQAERALTTSKGALVIKITEEVQRGTGLMEGDVIVALNRTLITSAKQVRDVIESFGSRQAFRIYFERAGQQVYTDLVLRG